MPPGFPGCPIQPGIKVLGRKYQGDTGDCKSPAYSTPGSIPGRPTNPFAG